MKVSKNLSKVSNLLFAKVVLNYKKAKLEKVNNNVLISFSLNSNIDIDKVISDFIKGLKVPENFSFEIDVYDTELQQIIILT